MNLLFAIVIGGICLAAGFLIVSFVIIRKEEKHGSDD